MCSLASWRRSRWYSRSSHVRGDRGSADTDSLTHFINAIRLAKAQWQRGSGLEAALEGFGGDIVQAVQALKESRPEPTESLEEQLFMLWTALKECRDYCKTKEPEPLVYPFERSSRQVKDVLGFLFPHSGRLPSLNDASGNRISADISKHGHVEKFALGPYRAPRLFNGLWQLSSPAWGSGTSEKQEAALLHLVECGLTATDMADHYVSTCPILDSRNANS